MGKVKNWYIDIAGESHTISIEFHSFTGNHKVRVNDKPKNLDQSFKTKMVGLDQKIVINEKEIRLVIRGNKADVAVDGFYLHSKEKYTPLLPMPAWAWIFIIGCLAIPIYTLGGAVPAVIGILGAIYSSRISVNTNFNTPLRVLFACLITGVSWITLLMFINLMSSILT